MLFKPIFWAQRNPKGTFPRKNGGRIFSRSNTFSIIRVLGESKITIKVGLTFSQLRNGLFGKLFTTIAEI